MAAGEASAFFVSAVRFTCSKAAERASSLAVDSAEELANPYLIRLVGVMNVEMVRGIVPLKSELLLAAPSPLLATDGLAGGGLDWWSVILKSLRNS